MNKHVLHETKRKKEKEEEEEAMQKVMFRETQKKVVTEKNRASSV